MSDTDARAAHMVCEAMESVARNMAADNATIATALVLALARRLAEQSRSVGDAEASLGLVSEHLKALIKLYMQKKLVPET